MKYLLIILTLLIISCNDSSDTKYDCIVTQDPWDDTIQYIDCPDGTVHSTSYGAGLETGDIVDIETNVDILEVR